MASDIDSMSGGSTGNILNAIEVDSKNNEITNVVIVAGQNELYTRMEPDEFLWILRNKEERLTKLAESKEVALVAPPMQNFFDAEGQAKEEAFRLSLQKLDDDTNISILKNPIESFEDGRHLQPTKSSKSSTTSMI